MVAVISGFEGVLPSCRVLGPPVDELYVVVILLRWVTGRPLEPSKEGIGKLGREKLSMFGVLGIDGRLKFIYFFRASAAAPPDSARRLDCARVSRRTAR